MQTCTKCGETKPLPDFYKNPTMRDGYDRQCKVCKRAYRAEHYQKNRERILQWFRDYYAREPEKRRRKAAAKHTQRERSRRWYYRHQEEAKRRYREWCRNNLPIKRAQYARRRARKLSAIGEYTPQQIRELYGKQRGLCADCGKDLKRRYHEDHITPLSKGGSNAIYNIQLLCPRCNLVKSDKDPIAHAQSLGRLL